jgi:chemotaxis protein CheX
MPSFPGASAIGKERPTVTPAARFAEVDEDPVLQIADAESQWLDAVDAAVTDVFTNMLQQPCVAAGQPSPADCSAIVSAKVVFSGALEGRCIVLLSVASAERFTDALLGPGGDWDNEMVDDAVGELCNMIAGGWKRRLGPLAATCQLSVPCVSRGPAPDGAEATTLLARRFYTFSTSLLEVALALH